MRFVGGSRPGTLLPTEKRRDAEAMDNGVAASVDDQMRKRHAEAGAKVKPKSEAAPSDDKIGKQR